MAESVLDKKGNLPTNGSKRIQKKKLVPSSTAQGGKGFKVRWLYSSASSFSVGNLSHWYTDKNT